jgi:O-antigen/teichoic acid export membrane protein
MMLASLQLRAVQATDVKRDFFFSDYLGLRLLTTGLAFLAIVGLSLATMQDWQTILVIVAIGVAKSFASISDMIYGLLQRQERMDHIAVSMMMKGLLSLTVLGLGFYLSGQVLWGVIGLGAAWLLTMLFYDLPCGARMLAFCQENPNQAGPAAAGAGWTRLRPSWEPKTLARLAWLALPLGLVLMLFSLNNNIPRYFIEHYLGNRDLGFFAALAYLLVVGHTVVHALGQSASPRLAHFYQAGDMKKYRGLLLKLMALGALLGVSGVLVAGLGGRQLLSLLYRPEYAEHVDVFLCLMIAGGFYYAFSFLGYGLTAARYFRVQLPLFTLVAATSALACFWLIPSFGLLGAALALIISTVVQGLGSAVIIMHALRQG